MESRNWIHLARDNARRSPPVNTVINFRAIRFARVGLCQY